MVAKCGINKDINMSFTHWDAHAFSANKGTKTATIYFFLLPLCIAESVMTSVQRRLT